MHVLFRESHGLDEVATPRDLAQTPADLVVLSFSDSDLGAFAAGWRRGREGLPSLRLANLSALQHPLSVDTYLDATLGQARGILLRLLGGAAFWRYGVEQVARIARANGIALAVLPADGRQDAELDAASTLPVATLRRLTALCDAGAAPSRRRARWRSWRWPPASMPDRCRGRRRCRPSASGIPIPARNLPAICPTPACPAPVPKPHPRNSPPPDSRPLVMIPFYRAWLAAADTEGIAGLIRGFDNAGFRALDAFVPSLKDSETARWLRDTLPRISPAAIVNTTAFSARTETASPLDAANVPVFQVIHATSGGGQTRPVALGSGDVCGAARG